MKTNILVVCLGNICRSPLAEGIFKKHLNADFFDIDSAATSTAHIGEKPDTRSIAIAKINGVSIENQRARVFCEKDFQSYDHILVMDRSNYTNVIAMAKDEDQKNKVNLILNYAYPGQNKEVPDPYYGGSAGFSRVYDMLEKACFGFIQKHV